MTESERNRLLAFPVTLAAVKRQAEVEGLDRVFKDAGFGWREAGCSMCLGMNPDTLEPGQRCASASNRRPSKRPRAVCAKPTCSGAGQAYVHRPESSGAPLWPLPDAGFGFVS